jgi:hypothetical protein
MAAKDGEGIMMTGFDDLLQTFIEFARGCIYMGVPGVDRGRP